MLTLARGAAAGAMATGPMSAVMLAGRALGAMPKEPPEEIVDSTLAEAGIHVSTPTSHVLATLNHFAFGAAAGAVYGLLRRSTRRRGHGPATGVAYGLTVWFVSYQGWVPRLTLVPPTSEDRNDRQVTMALAHVVYGGVLGALAD